MSSRTRLASSIVLASIACCSIASAADVFNIGTTWATSPAVQTLDVNSFSGAIGQAGVRDNNATTARIFRQSFTVTTGFTVGSIYLSAQDYNPSGSDYTIAFYQITNPTSSTAADWSTTTAVQVGSTITISSEPTLVTGATNLNLRVDLSLAEQITLSSASSYFIAISSLNVGNTTQPAFNWRHSNSGVDQYAGGRLNASNSNFTSNTFPTADFGLALTAAAVPEPSSFAAVAGLATLGFVGLRRRRS